MAIKIGVLAKQVIDPEMPMAAFKIDDGAKRWYRHPIFLRL